MPTSRHLSKDPPKRQPIQSLNGLRFVAAMLIVVYHYGGRAAKLQGPLTDSVARWFPLLRDGHLAVDFFAILSGFVLAYSHYEAIGVGRFRYRDFLARRFARIYPLHLVMLLFCLGMAVSARLLHIPLNHPDNFSYSAILPNLLLLHSFGVTRGLTFNGPSWFVSALFFTYLLFPVLVSVLSHSPMRSYVNVVLTTGVFLGVYFLMPGDQLLTDRTFDLGVVRVLVEFPIGIELFQMLRDYESSHATTIRGWHILVIGLLIAASMQIQIDEAAIVLLLGLFIFVCAAAELKHGPSCLIGPRWLHGGKISYAMYMTHVPFLACVLKVLLVSHLILRGTLGSDLAIVVLAILAVPLAMVVERYIERPAYRWTVGVLPGREKPATSAA